ncbi:glycoside hydrolase family 3 C-terminal domain-containing protein [Myxococcota bacterium]|nr:glycoside hydrolase family 3 C-terminal domain-containing protein [Myxococcota bacterium]
MGPSKKTILKAFDSAAIHAGNFGRGLDHPVAAREADALLSRMSPAQKANEIRGRQAEPIEGLYHAGGDETLDLEPWKMVDGPRGARAGYATAFPVASARAASFDVNLERRVGEAIGLEVAAKGGNVLLAPTLNLLRHPGWGRAQETYSEDPHHMGAMAVAFVSGVQNHVLASPKHFALNNLENNRFSLSSEIDERALHEVYLPHFKRCVVEAAAGSIMSAYNKVNGIYCGEHPRLLDEILRGDWGFRGFVESDWFLGARSTAPSLRAGLDIEMPAGFRFSDEALEEALESGELSQEHIDRAARRSVHQKMAWKLGHNHLGGKPRPDESVVECDEHVALALEAAEKSLVLLKNARDVLPLERTDGLKLAVVGDLADTVNLGDRGSSMVTSTTVSTPIEAIRAIAGPVEVEYFRSHADLSGLSEFDATLIVAGLTYRDEGEFVPTAQVETEGDDLARGGDRAGLDLPRNQRDLIQRSAKHSKRTVVVLQSGSAIVVRDWIDSVDALLMAWYGGREGGAALAHVLFGEVSPTGRLPVSVPRKTSDLMPWDVTAQRVDHDLLHGYRWLEHHGHEPEFPFGFGLGYTRFDCANLDLTRTTEGFLCRVDVHNSGKRRGATIVQLYVSCTDSGVFRVPQELKGFGRVELDPGAEATLEIEISDADLRIYDSESRAWRLEECCYQFRIGQSSADLPLTANWVRRSEEWRPVRNAT